MSVNGSVPVTQGPRDIFHGLGCLLASLSGGNSRSLTLLQGKMAASSVPFLPIPRLVEFHDDNEASPNSNEIKFAISPGEPHNEAPSSEWVPASVVTAVHQRNEPNGSNFSGGFQLAPATRFEPSFLPEIPVTNHSNFGATRTAWTPVMWRSTLRFLNWFQSVLRGNLFLAHYYTFGLQNVT